MDSSNPALTFWGYIKQYFLKFFEYKKLPLMIFSAAVGAALVLAVVFLHSGITSMTVSGTEAGEILVDFLNERAGGGVELVSVEDTGSLYEVTVLYQSMEIPVYMTKDGEYFVQGAEKIALTGQAVSQGIAGSEIPKSSKPVVELFVMTHCPYGTQAEKGAIPVLELLDGKIEGTIRFVHYFIHGDQEEQETYRQLCIREEQRAKFIDYLKCFLEAGDSSGCLTKAGVDKAKLDSCVSNNAEKYYEEDSDLSQQYGVQGSPTLIVNGAQSGAGRSSASYLDGICSAFTDALPECSEALSSASPSPGFGYSEGTGSSSSASCS